MTETKKIGFALLSPERRKEMAILGGRAANKAGKKHKFTAESARAAGRLGGLKISTNKEYMKELGRKGGQKVSLNKEHMVEIGRLGGAKTYANRMKNVEWKIQFQNAINASKEKLTNV